MSPSLALFLRGSSTRRWLLAALTGAWPMACAAYDDQAPNPNGVDSGGTGKPATAGTTSGGAPAAGAGTVASAGTTAKAGTTSEGGGTDAVGGTESGGSGGTCSAGAPGCADECPMDPAKTEPGDCGCGVPDTDTLAAASCLGLREALVHRYSFEGDANDSVGTAHGKVVLGTVVGGAVTLRGGTSGDHVDLPNGIIKSLTNATFEAWVTWTDSAGGIWQRIFDFGSSDLAEGTSGNGNKYVFLSPQQFRVAYSSATPPNEVRVDSAFPFPSNTSTHVAVVVDDASNTLRLYLGGVSQASSALTLPLSALDDVNNWLGKSQFAADPGFGGKISEFRIYDAALTELQLKASLTLGDNATTIDPK